MAYINHSKDVTHYYIAINIIQFKSLPVLTQNQIPLRYTSHLSILLHYSSSASRFLIKSSILDGFAIA